VRRQFQRGEIFRCGAQTRGNKNHALSVDIMQGAHDIFISAIQSGQITVKFVSRFINHIKTERRVPGTEKVRYR
jgi:hypothetical protein